MRNSLRHLDLVGKGKGLLQWCCEEVLKDAGEVKRYVDKKPDLQTLYTRGVSLYREITEKALENERNAKP